MKKLLCLGLLSCCSLIASTKLHFTIEMHGKQFTLEETYDGKGTSFSQTQDNVTFNVTCSEVTNDVIACDVVILEDNVVVAHPTLSAKIGTTASITLDENHEHIVITLLAHEDSFIDSIESHIL